MDPLELGLAVGGLAVYVLLAWRSPPQAIPGASHGGLRWRVWHARALRPGSVLPMLGVMAVLATGWVVVAAVMASLVRRPITDGELDVVLIAPIAGAVVAVLVVPWMVRAAWTRIEADPAQIRLVRPWPRRAIVLRWSEVRWIGVRRQALVLKTAAGRVVIEAPQAEPAHLRQVADWLRATRAAPAEPVPVPPLPRPLRQLLHQGRRTG